MEGKRGVGLRVALIAGLLMALNIPMAPMAAAATPRPANCTLNSNLDFDDLNEGPTDYTLNLRPSGVVKVIVLFVDFPDEVSTENTHDIEDLLMPGLETDYATASYGKLDVQVDFQHEWYRMPDNANSYDYHDFFGQQQLFIDATDDADADVNFSPYDIILTVEGETGGGFHEDSPAWIGADFPVQTNEGPIKWGATLGQDIYLPSRGFITPVHEIGHVFGLPDLYSFTGEQHQYVGSWDIMGNIDAMPGMSAWHRNKMGWLANNQVVCVGYSGTKEVTLTPLADVGGKKLVIVKTSNSKAYAIEYRTNEGLDGNLCDSGILVYRVDANVATGKGPVKLVPAHDPPGDFSCPSDVNGYGPLQTPAFDLDAGGDSTFDDKGDALEMEVLSINDSQAIISIDYQGGQQQPLNYTRDVVIKKVTNKGVIKGRVKAESGAPGGCEANAPLRVRATKNDNLVAKEKTNAKGSFRIKLPRNKRTGRIYVAAPEDKASPHFCLNAHSSNFKV